MDLLAPAEGSGCGPSGGFAQTLLIVAIYDEIRQWETIAGTGKSAPACSVFSGNIEIGGKEMGVKLFAEFPFLPDWFIPLLLGSQSLAVENPFLFSANSNFTSSGSW
ncbi:hypothetical protein [Planctopirus limnophila]|uniref:hypothetical protein n=1 Tax=Planctopirus limnophila TaxID=120 RepID=UPI0001A2FC98|nr:hypothetical protein [Planctopirus limnophila]